MDGQTYARMDNPWGHKNVDIHMHIRLYYKLTKLPKGSGELKTKAKKFAPYHIKQWIDSDQS